MFSDRTVGLDQRSENRRLYQREKKKVSGWSSRGTENKNPRKDKMFVLKLGRRDTWPVWEVMRDALRREGAS